MKHTAHRIHHHMKRHIKNTKAVSILVPAFLAVLALIFMVNTSTATVHDSELRFAETSGVVGIVGSMLPASCESDGNSLAGPGHTAACVWTQYCTGGSDANGNNWQIWEYSNDDTVDYRSTGVSCAQPTMSAVSCNAAGTVATLSWGAVSGASNYPVRVDNAAFSCGTGVNGVTGPAPYSCISGTEYVNDSLTGTSVSVNITPGTTYSWWVHSLSSGIWSPYTKVSFSCAPPTPSVNLNFQ
jgi:hypothetical protein